MSKNIAQSTWGEARGEDALRDGKVEEQQPTPIRKDHPTSLSLRAVPLLMLNVYRVR
jgi:hypothetical protein